MLINDKRKYIVLVVAAILSLTNIITTSAQAVVIKPVIKSCLSPFGQYRLARHLNSKQLVQVLQYAGFKGHALKVAWAVAMKETHGNPVAHNFSHWTQDDSYGVFQINLYGALKGRLSHYGLKSAKQLTDPIKNAQIAFSMSSGGKNWSPWHSNPGQRDYWVVKQWMDKYPAIT